MEGVTRAATNLVGRDVELAAVADFVLGQGDARALLIAGPPGIGKTAIWRAGIEAARTAGWTVLEASPAEADARRSFSGLIDLLRAVPNAAFGRLPAPQRRALLVALLRADATDPPTGPGRPAIAVAPAVLGVLDGLTATRPLLLAIDDVTWLDSASATAVAFAARRLGQRDMRLLLARRPGRLSKLERDAAGLAIERLDLGALSFGATRQVITERLGVSLSHRAMRDLHAHSGGNPMFALELAALGERDADDAVPPTLPAAIDDVVGARFDALPAAKREILVAVALAPTPSSDELAARFGSARVEAAVDAGLITIDGPRVRAAHPLLATVAIARSSRAARRAAHAALAGVASDDERRLWHLAGATTGSDAALAAELSTIAQRAAGRGAAEDAVDLSAEAVRLTPPDDPARPDRIIGLGERLMLTGEHPRIVALVTPLLDTLPAGRTRARARLLLTEASFHVSNHHVRDATASLMAAVTDAADDPQLLAVVLAYQAHHDAIGLVAGVRNAERDARRALELAAGSPEGRAAGRYALAWTAHVRGHWPNDLATDDLDAEPDLMRAVGRALAERHVAEGRLREARARLERLLAVAEERGEMWSYVAIRLQLLELELRVGSWDRAEALLAEWGQALDLLSSASGYERTRAFLAGGRGDAREALRWAALALEHSEARGLGWDRLESLRATGLAELAAGRPAAAAATLGEAWRALRSAGVADPGLFPVAPDLVEAQVLVGDLSAARRVARAVARFGTWFDHPWAAVTGLRCLALIDLEAGDAAARVDATARLRRAAEAYAALGLGFDRARTLLALGRLARRGRHWADARQALEAAVSAFEELGSPGWADQARDELLRIGGRRPNEPTALTATERRVAGLAVDGLSNKEIATALAVSVATVERHLSHTYAKLGLQSRAQLVRHLVAGAAE